MMQHRVTLRWARYLELFDSFVAALDFLFNCLFLLERLVACSMNFGNGLFELVHGIMVHSLRLINEIYAQLLFAQIHFILCLNVSLALVAEISLLVLRSACGISTLHVITAVLNLCLARLLPLR